MGFGEAMLAVSLMKDIDTGSIDGNPVKPVKKSTSIENSFPNESPDHFGWQELQLVWIKIGEGSIQGVPMRYGCNPEKDVEGGLGSFGVEAKLDLADSLKPGKEDEQPGEEQAGQGIVPRTIHSWIVDMGKEIQEGAKEMVKCLEEGPKNFGGRNRH